MYKCVYICAYVHVEPLFPIWAFETSMCRWQGQFMGLHQDRPEDLNIFTRAGLYIFIENVYSSTWEWQEDKSPWENAVAENKNGRHNENKLHSRKKKLKKTFGMGSKKTMRENGKVAWMRKYFILETQRERKCQSMRKIAQKEKESSWDLYNILGW